MLAFKKRFTRLAAGIEHKFDDLFFHLRKRLGSDKPLQIVPFRSYGTVNRLYIKGRVLQDNPVKKSTDKDSVWNNLLNMYRRFESDEVRDARLKITFQGRDHFVLTNDEGYFVLQLATQTPLHWEDMWHEVDIELVGAPFGFQTPLKTFTQVLVPPADAEYGIISDIDDTIVKTTATNLLAMSRNTLFHNAHTRLPFAGVAEFYKALQLGRNGKRNNPFFYVSSSPWNLYDLLIDFMDLNKIPEGPLLLRDFGLETGKAVSSDHMGHKFGEISGILKTYPHLNFVLIGDSGQEDPAIYKEVVAKFPNRILAVYIRDVQLPEREKIAVDISKSFAADTVEMVIVDNTVEAAAHAAKIKLIYTESIPDIVQDKEQDKGQQPGKDELA
jgi:phosphatidate phosphatase APP1